MNHTYEQIWLDKAIDHLKVLKTRTNDPDLQNVLDYCIARYHKIGAVGRDGHAAGLAFPGDKTLGHRTSPFCPGVSLDYETLQHPYARAL